MIGGNIELELQIKDGETKNELSEQVTGWKQHKTLWGFLDLSSGSTNYTNYNAKIEESTHVFICDYTEIGARDTELRAVCNGAMYDVTYIDDPMNLHEHLEIFLKKVE